MLSMGYVRWTHLDGIWGGHLDVFLNDFFNWIGSWDFDFFHDWDMAAEITKFIFSILRNLKHSTKYSHFIRHLKIFQSSEH
jgi:hypothetical protein